MKWFIAIWLLCAGTGVSFSVIKERKSRVILLKEMEHSLKKLAYYMYQWKMPAEEAFRHVAEEEKGGLQDFYKAMHGALTEKAAENIGDLWQEKSRLYLAGANRDLTGAKQEWAEDKKELAAWQSWQACFLHIPMEGSALNNRLLLRAEEIAACRTELEGKYEGEQKLVLTLGVFVGAFICLVLW